MAAITMEFCTPAPSPVELSTLDWDTPFTNEPNGPWLYFKISEKHAIGIDSRDGEVKEHVDFQKSDKVYPCRVNITVTPLVS